MSWDTGWSTMPPEHEIRELNERLKQLAAVVYTLQGYARESKKAPVTYRMLAENLYNIWKKYATTLRLRGSMGDEVARELGYSALAVYCVGQKAEREAYSRSAQLVCELLLGWQYRVAQSSD